jgi:hypothetical protein
MLMQLNRRWLTEESTVGELSVSDERLAYVLEDRYRGDDPTAKVQGRTAIPCGRYEIVIAHSPRFRRDLPLLLNVPGFSGIRIHPGNDADDTDGCLLPGLDRWPDKVTRSREAYELVFLRIQSARAKGELVFINIEVKEEPHVGPNPSVPVA